MRLKQLDFEFRTHIDFSQPVSNHYFVLRCLPYRSPTLRVSRAEVETSPSSRLATQRDGFGNTLSVGSVVEEHDSFSYGGTGRVIIDLSRALPQEPHPMYRYATDLTRPDEAILDFAHEQKTAGLSTSEVAETIAHAVHAHMLYLPGSTTVNTTAAQAFAKGQGVCQDFAHITLAILRELGIFARYVSGLTVGEGETHAWVEINENGIWTGFDPTRDQRVDETYLPLAVGRDWASCPIENGSFLGLVDQTQQVSMAVKEHIEQ